MQLILGTDKIGLKQRYICRNRLLSKIIRKKVYQSIKFVQIASLDKSDIFSVECIIYFKNHLVYLYLNSTININSKKFNKKIEFLYFCIAISQPL